MNTEIAPYTYQQMELFLVWEQWLEKFASANGMYSYILENNLLEEFKNFTKN